LDKLARELAHIAAVTMKRGDDTAKRERAIVVTKEKRRVTVTTKTRGPRWRGFLRHETSGPNLSIGRAHLNPRCRKIPLADVGITPERWGNRPPDLWIAED